MTVTTADETNKDHSEEWLSGTVAAFIRAAEVPTKVQAFPSASFATVNTCVKSQKSDEIDRQIERIRPYLSWAAKSPNCGIDQEGLNASIAMLRSLSHGPSPVPMLSVSNDGKASLYFSQDDVSLEALFEKCRVEYLFSDNKTNNSDFEEEDVLNGQIPSKLLYILYAHFAKNMHSSAK